MARRPAAEEADTLFRDLASTFRVPLDYGLMSDWRAQHALFVDMNIDLADIIGHLGIFLVGVDSGIRSVPACPSCNHSPHVGGEGEYCSAIVEDECACGCDEDGLS